MTIYIWVRPNLAPAETRNMALRYMVVSMVVVLSCDDLLKWYHLLKTISCGLKCVSFCWKNQISLIRACDT